MSTRSLKGGLHVMMDRAFMTQVRLHCAPDVTAPHSFNMLLQQCAKEQKLFVIVANTPQPRAAHFAHENWHLQHFQITPATCKSPCRERSPLCSQKFAPRRNGRPRYDSIWHRATTPAHFVHKIRTAPQRETTLRSKIVTAPHAHT